MYGALAQVVEQLPFKQRVTGSSPVRLTPKFDLFAIAGVSLLVAKLLKGARVSVATSCYYRPRSR